MARQHYPNFFILKIDLLCMNRTFAFQQPSVHFAMSRKAKATILLEKWQRKLLTAWILEPSIRDRRITRLSFTNCILHKLQCVSKISLKFSSLKLLMSNSIDSKSVGLPAMRNYSFYRILKRIDRFHSPNSKKSPPPSHPTPPNESTDFKIIKN